MKESIESFWNQAKRVLRKYNEIDRKSFPLFLKEKAAVKNSAALVWYLGLLYFSPKKYPVQPTGGIS